MPVPLTLGCVLLIQALPQACHCLSMHIGSSTDAAPNSAVDLGEHTQPLEPARSSFGWPPSLSGQSMIVAFLAISAGAALVAFAIFCVALIVAAPILGVFASPVIVCCANAEAEPNARAA